MAKKKAAKQREYPDTPWGHAQRAKAEGKAPVEEQASGGGDDAAIAAAAEDHDEGESSDSESE